MYTPNSIHSIVANEVIELVHYFTHDQQYKQHEMNVLGVPQKLEGSF